mmetsp:Transcript_9889/g.13252  ORF Transcript_9889/g.13252 Transcript_9889/m.13252 type:complete len:340 (+) Transcript_9889:109-1128(+)
MSTDVPTPSNSSSELKSTASATTTSTKNGRPKIVLWGDSITQMSSSALDSGFSAHLSDAYQRRADVYNRGYSGYNTDWFLSYCKTTEGYNDILTLGGIDHTASGKGKEKSSVELVTIFFGANDASHHIHNKRQHVPLDKYKSNLKELIMLARKWYGQKVKIILMSPPPVYHAQRLQYQIDRYGKEKATGILERTLELSGEYAKVVGEVVNEAENENVAFLDLWTSMQEEDKDGWSRFLSDGLHLSRDGNIFVGKALLQTIAKQFPQVAVHADQQTGLWGNSASKCGEALERFGPWHDEINFEQEIFAKMKKFEKELEGGGNESLKRKRDESIGDDKMEK